MIPKPIPIPIPKFRMLPIVCAVFLFASPPLWAGTRQTLCVDNDTQDTRFSSNVRAVFMDLLDHVAATESWDIVYGRILQSGSRPPDSACAADIGLAQTYRADSAVAPAFNKETLLSTWGQVYVNPGSPIHSPQDLDQQTIALVPGDPFSENVRAGIGRLNVRCQFVEVKNYHQVMESVRAGWVDAGVVERFFGMELEKEYKAEKSPIIFGPLELRFKAHSAPGRQALATLDYHLGRMKADRSSLYYVSLANRLRQAETGGIPLWLPWAGGAAGVALCVAFLWNFFLRFQISRKSRELDDTHGTLRKEIETRKGVEEQFRQAQKMEAIGRLAGGVAHDLNNMLMVIDGYAQMTLEQLAGKPRMRAQLAEVQKAAKRAGGITQQLLAFSRKQILAPTRLRLNDVLIDTMRLLERMVGEDIQFRTSFIPNLHLVEVDPNALQQVIMNLAVNARDAMPRGGIFSLSTRNARVDEALVQRHAEIPPGEYAVLEIGDTGIGMDAGTQDKIFEPFFTTKEVGKGTGLGLATVYGIVKQSGGYIWFYSEPGKGTIFKIYFPRSKCDFSLPEALPRIEEELSGTGNILLVEDETSVRKLVKAALKGKGYRVIEASNGITACETARNFKGRIDLLLTDVVMPGMGGHELTQRLLETIPGLKVIYMSGYNESLIADHGILKDGVTLMQKPFNAVDVIRRVRELLAEDSGSGVRG